MRLMQRRIKMAQAEREVDRIDVFERGSEKREMQCEVDDGDEPRSHGDTENFFALRAFGSRGPVIGRAGGRPLRGRSPPVTRGDRGCPADSRAPESRPR